VGALIACGRPASEARRLDVEYSVQMLPLAGDLAQRKAEISGFAWYGDQLIALPQRPTWNPANGPQGCFYALSREALERAAGGDRAPLEGRRVPLAGAEKITSLPGVQGLEAISVQGDRVFLLIEAQSPERKMRGYLALGHVEGALERVVIDSVSTIELPAQTGVDNLSYEALVSTKDEVFALYEANGALNPSPQMLCFDPAGQRVEARQFPHLEYRITDATPPGADGTFWAINYFYPPELALACEVDDLTERFGIGPSQRPGGLIERLVRMRLDKGNVSLTTDPPLRLRVGEQARNWEALAVLPGKGFLLATDMYPQTLFGFVPYEGAR
jgi:hypothetical protein